MALCGTNAGREHAAVLLGALELGARALALGDEAALGAHVLEVRERRVAIDDARVGVHAAEGIEALAVLEHDHNFDLVICDLQMPVDGIAVYDTLAKTAPAMVDRLVFISGGAVTVRAREFIARLQPRVFRKPLDMDALLSFVADLSRRAAPAAVR